MEIEENKNQSTIIQYSKSLNENKVLIDRISNLLYKRNKKIYDKDTLMISCNKSSLNNISHMLKDFKSDNAYKKTFEELALNFLNIKSKVYTKEEKLIYIKEEKDKTKIKFIINSSKIKGNNIYMSMMNRYIKYIQLPKQSDKDIKIFKYTIFTVKEINRLFFKDLKHLLISERKKEIEKYFNKCLKDRIDKVLEDLEEEYSVIVEKLKKSMENGDERRKQIVLLYNERDKKKMEIRDKSLDVLKEYFKAWKYNNIKDLYLNFFNDSEAFNQVTSGKIPEVLSEYMKNEINKNFKKNTIDSDDLMAMLYLKFLIEGVPKEKCFKHILICEAQDCSIFQMQLLKYINENNSFTVLGDMKKSVYYYKGINDWNKIMDEIYEKKVDYIQLS